MKGWRGVGWGGVGGACDMLLRCTDVWQCCFAVYMKGWGGVWLHVTFLVLLPLHVATLPNVIQKWPEKQRLCMSG